jgi:hypothetical protein
MTPSASVTTEISTMRRNTQFLAKSAGFGVRTKNHSN